MQIPSEAKWMLWPSRLMLRSFMVGGSKSLVGNASSPTSDVNSSYKVGKSWLLIAHAEL